ncbi:ABC transporter ATP-binding protein [Neisseria chenwenguii]|uniref:Cobalamin/Fe(3+)-siderophore ABC transporter ATP-binding protein n=1 Tax=Neisseria chenwenguii TaxID=1853278 RepID=A0A220S3W4_9NEIS|nr:ABC transporter ATP-binding protein [Neisseria chenwenguii]ASK28088.1 cobalamin/Fe(3+)-siderophore ABC transporter ATP-binding protein [Neisseria chenwenguii]ROV57239.1 ABC transporter ATP-binding protein [Neisseria chenwenguii]
MFQIQNLTLSYQDKTIINDISFTLPEQQITVFIGANGCGKSTLLKAVAGQLPPKHGEILLHSKNVYRYPGKALAQQLAMLAQTSSAAENISVAQLVRYGRYPYHSLVSRWTDEDEKQVQRAMRLTQTDHLADNLLDNLSGGQRQRAWIAMALAQDTPYLFLDEPTTYLDLNYQIELLDLLKNLNRKQNKTIVMVLHDLNLAARYADCIISLKNGKLLAQGAPQEVITAENVETVFGLKNQIIQDPVYHTPMCVPIGSDAHEV